MKIALILFSLVNDMYNFEMITYQQIRLVINEDSQIHTLHP